MATNKDAQSDLRISFVYQIQLEKTNTANTANTLKICLKAAHPCRTIKKCNWREKSVFQSMSSSVVRGLVYYVCLQSWA